MSHEAVDLAPSECPACGGSGGGPFGRMGSAWDVETYVCPRCEGLGVLRAAAPLLDEEAPPMARPGIAKTVPPPSAGHDSEKKRRANAG